MFFGDFQWFPVFFDDIRRCSMIVDDFFYDFRRFSMISDDVRRFSAIVDFCLTMFGDFSATCDCVSMILCDFSILLTIHDVTMTHLISSSPADDADDCLHDIGVYA